MEDEKSEFSPQDRAAAKAASRAQDEAMLSAGQISRGQIARANGGSLHGVRYNGPSRRIQALAGSLPSLDSSTDTQ
jgi:hypothetical protein